MKVSDILKNPNFKLITGMNIDREINDFYAGDMLSWVMSHAKENDGWLTVQTHLNILAVSELCNLSCIIIVDEAVIEEDTITKAKEENIVLLQTTLSTVEVIRCFT